MVRIHLPPPLKRLCPESTFRQINSRCFKTFVLTAFFYLSCASRSPSFDGRGFLVCGCLALLDRRSAMLTLVGTACRRRIHLPPPFTCSTVCKDGFFVLKLPLLQQFFYLAEKRWKDWLCSTNIPQFAHICGKSPSTMSEVQK